MIPVFLKIDRFAYSILGKTVVYINYQGYIKQFDHQIEEGELKLEQESKPFF